MRKIVILFLLSLAIGFLINKKFGLVKNRNSERSLVLSNQTQVILITSAIPTPTITLKASSHSSLEDIMNNFLAVDEESFAIAIKNLKTGESFFANEHKKFDTGSIYKLWIMAAVFDQIKEGQLDEDQILSQKVAVLNDKFRISSEAAERTTGSITLPVYGAIFQMITYSDNYSALLLSEKVRLSRVATFLKTHEFNESKVGTDGSTPKTTAWDILQFFEKLYTRHLADEIFTEKMISILKEQKLNNKLPKYLPENTIVAHKTGEIYGFSHDAGIVYTSSGDYIIAVFSESDIPAQAEEQIARLSRAVYDYFVK